MTARTVLLLGLALGLPAQTLALPEVEPNDTFADRQQIALGATSLATVEASIEDIFTSFDFSFQETLGAGEVDLLEITGQTPGDVFAAWIDNTVSGFGPDTVMGAFSENPSDTLLRLDDDSSPLGDGFASALAETVNADGTIRLRVSGWPDFDFDGNDDELLTPHQETGDYDLFVRLIAPDVDFISFSGLPPGHSFAAEVTTAEFEDSILGLFNDSGTLVATDDDGGVGFLSRLEAVVPQSGELHFAVAVWDDFDFDGIRDQDTVGPWGVGNYTLTLPEPGAGLQLGLALATLGALAGLRGARRARG